MRPSASGPARLQPLRLRQQTPRNQLRDDRLSRSSQLAGLRCHRGQNRRAAFVCRSRGWRDAARAGVPARARRSVPDPVQDRGASGDHRAPPRRAGDPHRRLVQRRSLAVRRLHSPVSAAPVSGCDDIARRTREVPQARFRPRLEVAVVGEPPHLQTARPAPGPRLQLHRPAALRPPRAGAAAQASGHRSGHARIRLARGPRLAPRDGRDLQPEPALPQLRQRLGRQGEPGQGPRFRDSGDGAADADGGFSGNRRVLQRGGGGRLSRRRRPGRAGSGAAGRCRAPRSPGQGRTRPPRYIAALAIAPRGQPEFEPPFSIAITVASLLYGLLALALAYLLAAEVAGRRAAGIGVAVVAGATSFAYYLVYEPSYSHTFSSFALRAFLLAWWRGRDRRSSAGWLGLGLLGGLMALTRFQDGALVAIALLDLPRARWRVLLLAPGLVLAFLPQVAVDQALFGTWLPIRPAGQELSLASGHYLEVLFSSYHGLFSWTPATLLAVAGFALLRERRLQLAFAYALIVETAINGAAPDWWGGFSFGMRRFLDLTPFFAIGLAVLAARLAPLAGRLGAGALIAWNLVLVANFTYVIRGDP